MMNELFRYIIFFIVAVYPYISISNNFIYSTEVLLQDHLPFLTLLYLSIEYALSLWKKIKSSQNYNYKT